jgi:N-acetylmuramoyl-L-alanine amidase
LIGAGVLAGCRATQPAAFGPAASAPAADPMVSVNTLLPAEPDYAARRIGTAGLEIPAYAKYLKGARIVLDPGHGGDAHQRAFKRGPTGVREAEMNLRVAQYLREFLRRVGAEVRLTRETDVDLTHADRAAVANAWPADLFISLHHNAIDKKPTANHTTVWYHDTVERDPASLDLARHLCDALRDGLALPQLADVPLKSDKLMYKDGFAVLRHASVTAALTESSFYTNPDEEQRLRDPAYNLREAHALFLGLARYAAGGWPRAQLLTAAATESEVATRPSGAPHRLIFELHDGLRERKSWGHERSMILTDSIAVRIDGLRAPHTFVDRDGRYLLHVDLPYQLAPGLHTAEVHFQNMSKNSNLQRQFVFKL